MIKNRLRLVWFKNQKESMGSEKWMVCCKGYKMTLYRCGLERGKAVLQLYRKIGVLFCTQGEPVLVHFLPHTPAEATWSWLATSAASCNSLCSNYFLPVTRICDGQENNLVMQLMYEYESFVKILINLYFNQFNLLTIYKLKYVYLIITVLK